MPTVLTCKLVKRHECSSHVTVLLSTHNFESKVMSYFPSAEVEVVFRVTDSLSSFSSPRDVCVSEGTSKLLVQLEGLLSG